MYELAKFVSLSFLILIKSLVLLEELVATWFLVSRACLIGSLAPRRGLIRNTVTDVWVKGHPTWTTYILVHTQESVVVVVAAIFVYFWLTLCLVHISLAQCFHATDIENFWLEPRPAASLWLPILKILNPSQVGQVQMILHGSNLSRHESWCDLIHLARAHKGPSCVWTDRSLLVRTVLLSTLLLPLLTFFC